MFYNNFIGNLNVVAPLCSPDSTPTGGDLSIFPAGMKVVVDLFMLYKIGNTRTFNYTNTALEIKSLGFGR
jgi:hypothetical protein